MSISKRLIDLARSELNSLLEKAGRTDEERDDDDRRYGTRGGGAGADLSSMSDEELAAEIERRRRAREEVEEVVGGRRRPPPPRQAPPRQPPPRTPPRTAAGDDAIRKAYAALEVPPGSDFETVRKSYRRLMRKYHPDLHAGTPDKNRAATDLTQRLTQAYKTLEKHMRR
jgi:DnaJ-domain-containing protein 1